MYAIAVACDSGCAQNAYPESYGTLSHLWPSQAHESARSSPSTRCAVRGLAAAQSPKAPSTWTQAPTACARLDDGPEVVASAGVHVSRLRADDRRPGSASPSPERSASASIAPSARRSDLRRSPLSRGRGGGRRGRSSRAAPRRRRPAPSARRWSPSRPTSQPCWFRTCQRAAARPIVLAPCPPVAKPTDAARRKAEELLEPAAGDVLERDRRRRERLVVRALVPPGGDHVGDERGVERAARSRSRSTAGPPRPSGPGVAARDELVDHARRAAVGLVARARRAPRARRRDVPRASRARRRDPRGTRR